IKAPRFALGFANEENSQIKYTRCTAENIAATSSTNLSSPKEAFGFSLEGATHTALKYVSVKYVTICGEERAPSSNSTAAGIFIDSETQNTKIICPRIEDINGGAGDAFKIDDQGTNTIIKRCKKR